MRMLGRRGISKHVYRGIEMNNGYRLLFGPA